MTPPPHLPLAYGVSSEVELIGSSRAVHTTVCMSIYVSGGTQTTMFDYICVSCCIYVSAKVELKMSLVLLHVCLYMCPAIYACFPSPRFFVSRVGGAEDVATIVHRLTPASRIVPAVGGGVVCCMRP